MEKAGGLASPPVGASRGGLTPQTVPAGPMTMRCHRRHHRFWSPGAAGRGRPPHVRQLPSTSRSPLPPFSLNTWGKAPGAPALALPVTLRGRTWVSDPGCSRRRGEGHPVYSWAQAAAGSAPPQPPPQGQRRGVLSPPCAIPALPTQSCLPPDTSHLPRASLPLLQGRGNRGPLAGSRGDSDHGPAPSSGEGH